MFILRDERNGVYLRANLEGMHVFIKSRGWNYKGRSKTTIGKRHGAATNQNAIQ